jgi:glucosylglycerate synthase
LPEESILTDDFLRELINAGEADILIGVPTYNDAATVGQVVQAVRAGLLKYFPRQRAVIVNADGGSRDNTQDLIRAASISDLNHGSNLHALRTLHCISTRYPGEPCGGTALHTFLAAAELLRACACAVISAESSNADPEWIERLLRPVVRDHLDLVTPIYCRHKFDGLLVTNLLYPMTRALYCKRIREPHPSEFAFSGQLASHFLGQDIWNQDVARNGTETLLVIAAMAGDFRTGQSLLGPKCRVDHAPADLVGALRQTVGALFWSLEQNLPRCDAGAGAPSTVNEDAAQTVTAEPMRVNRKRLHQMFTRGVAELEPVLVSILQPSTLAELKRVAAIPEDGFRYSDELWVRTVYEFAAAYHKSTISRDHIVQALAPLYRGRAYTFLVESRDTSGEEAEKHIETLCLTFEQMKPYLFELWDGGK